jgi:hypothetical protein
MEEQKMTIGEAVNELTRVSNVFRAAEKLKDALQVVANLEGEKNVTMQAIREAEARKKVALREADTAEARGFWPSKHGQAGNQRIQCYFSVDL